MCERPCTPAQWRTMHRASPRTRARRSALGACRKRRRAKDALAASASRAPVPTGRGRASRAISRS
eukprot:6878593-Alexandrium_andersonii.AAC.1